MKHTLNLDIASRFRVDGAGMSGRESIDTNHTMAILTTLKYVDHSHNLGACRP
jgi:hypothetical protein